MFKYTRADGSVQRELRHPEDVFHADSLSTMQGMAVTDMHPPKGVSPSSWGELSVGTVGDDIREDSAKPGHVAAYINVAREDAISAVESGKRVELSCGYSCKLDSEAGTYNGEAYDVRQRDIRYNHVALLPRGMGRAGSTVQLRLDSEGHESDESQTPPPDDSSAAGDAPPASNREDSMIKIKVDGVEYDPATDAKGLAAAIERQDGKHAAELAAAKAQAEEAIQRADAADAKAAEAIKPEAIQARVDARAVVLASARKLAGDELKCDGLSDAEIMRAAVTKHSGAELVEGRADSFVEGVFATLAANAKSDKGSDRADAIDPADVMSNKPPAAKREPRLQPWQRPTSVTAR